MVVKERIRGRMKKHGGTVIKSGRRSRKANRNKSNNSGGKKKPHVQNTLQTLPIHRHLDRNMGERIVDAAVRTRALGGVVCRVLVKVLDGADPVVGLVGCWVGGEGKGLTPWSRSG
jgi:hypothetical protein